MIWQVWLVPAAGALLAVLMLPVRIELHVGRGEGGDRIDVHWLLPGRFRLRLGFVAKGVRAAGGRLFARMRVEQEGIGGETAFTDEIGLDAAQETAKAATRPVRALLLGLKAAAGFLRGGGRGHIGSPALALLLLPLRVALLSLRRCERLQVRGRIGVGDAFATSLAVGALWSASAPFLGWFFAHTRLVDPPEIAFVADYERERFDLALHCILAFSLGQFIPAAIRTRWRGWMSG